MNNARGDSSLFSLQLKAYRKFPQITKDRLFIETMNEILGQTMFFQILNRKIEVFLWRMDA